MASPPSTNLSPELSLEIRIVVLGNGATGKSALTVMMCCHHFLEIYDPTVEDSYRTQVEVDGEVALLSILDTAGQTEYSALRDQYMRKGQGFVMVYAVDNYASFESLPLLREQIFRVWDLDPGSVVIPIVLCGNKTDLPHHEVTQAQGQALAASWHADFFETSAKTGYNVTEAFYQLVRAIRKSQLSKGGSNSGSRSRRRVRDKCTLF